MDRYGQILTDIDDINRYTHVQIMTQVIGYEQICTDMYRYKRICTDIGLIYTDMSGYLPHMHRYGHIWVDPGLILGCQVDLLMISTDTTI